jgi:HPt (histidine-containing phosphotransfer) domain-containing protein
MTTATAQGDAGRLRQAAHTLKSGSANLGALEFAELCKQIEQQARANELAGVDELLTQLQQTFDEVRHALQYFKAGDQTR